MSGWLVYRMDDNQPRFLGVYRTREAAQTDIDTMGDDDWLFSNVPFIGFGVVTPDA